MSSVELSVPLFSSRPSFTRGLAKFFRVADMAMDLGTANTLVYVRELGIVLNEPSIVAIDESTSKPVAIGHEAKRIFGKTSQNIRCVRPLKDGVIADFESTALMIKDLLRRARGANAASLSFMRPRLVIGIPSGITQVEKRAVSEAALCAGVREVLLVEEPMAAALGCDLPIDRPVGNMVVDIGGGTTEVAIIGLNATVFSQSIRVAGDEMDEAIQRHLRRLFGLHIGIFEAERIKIMLGSALPLGRERGMPVYGRDVASGLPMQREVTDTIIREALAEPLSAIVSSVSAALEQTSPEVAQDVAARGVYLAGGGSLIKGLAERLSRETGIKFYRAHDPLSCVVRGVGKIVDNLKDYRVLCIG